MSENIHVHGSKIHTFYYYLKVLQSGVVVSSQNSHCHGLGSIPQAVIFIVKYFFFIRLQKHLMNIFGVAKVVHKKYMII
jgi:hypothetical protein